MTSERLPATGRVQDLDKYFILGYTDEDLRLNIGVLQSIARQIEINVFKVERKFAIEDVAFNFRNGGSMTVVVEKDTLNPIGYSSQLILAPMIEGYRRRIMLTTTRAIEELYQGKELGPATLRFSFNMHSPEIVAGIMGWAPPVDAYYKSGVVAELEGEARVAAEASIKPSGDEVLDEIRRIRAVVKLYPFYKPYTESDFYGEIRDYTLQKTRYKDFPYDPATGLMKGLWEKDSTLLFRAEKSSRRVEILGQMMTDEIHCDPTNGDGMLAMGAKKGWVPFIA